jgi:hypothetical protein
VSSTLACCAAPQNPDAGVQQMPVPPSVIPGGILDVSVLAEAAISKFADHMPLCRFIDRCSGLGVELSLSTLSVNHLLKRWDNFTRYTEHGDLVLSNNTAERALRKAALGRKNFLFVGNESGDEAAAIYYSTCCARCPNETALASKKSNICCPSKGRINSSRKAWLQEGMGLAGGFAPPSAQLNRTSFAISTFSTVVQRSASSQCCNGLSANPVAE